MIENEDELENNQDEPDQVISNSNDDEEKVRITVEMMGSIVDNSITDDSETEVFSSTKENSDLDETILMTLSSKRDSSIWTFNSTVIVYMTDQIDVFEVDLTGNESGRRKIIVNDETLFIKNCDIINVRLFRNSMRLYNVLFVFNLNANLVSLSRIILDGFQVVYDYKNCIINRKLNNQIMFQIKRLNNNRL